MSLQQSLSDKRPVGCFLILGLIAVLGGGPLGQRPFQETQPWR